MQDMQQNQGNEPAEKITVDDLIGSEPIQIVKKVLEEKRNYYSNQIESETSFRKIHSLITDILDNAEVMLSSTSGNANDQGKNAAKLLLKEYLPMARVYIEYQKARGLIKDDLANVLTAFIMKLVDLSEGMQGTQNQTGSGGGGKNEEIDLRTAIRRFRLFLDSLAVVAKTKRKKSTNEEEGGRQ